MSADAGSGPGRARRLVLVRHGRTAWNAERRFQGHADVELDEVGQAQAARVAGLVGRLSPDLLWSSDLARASQTAAHLAERTGLAVRTDPRLREFDVGERTGLTYADVRRRTGSLDHGETPADVLARMMPAYDELLASLAVDRTAAVVSHGACLRHAAASLLGWPDGLADSLRTMDNCGVAVLTDDGSGHWRLSAWNLTPQFAPAEEAG